VTLKDGKGLTSEDGKGCDIRSRQGFDIRWRDRVRQNICLRSAALAADLVRRHSHET